MSFIQDLIKERDEQVALEHKDRRQEIIEYYNSAIITKAKELLEGNNFCEYTSEASSSSRFNAFCAKAIAVERINERERNKYSEALFVIVYTKNDVKQIVSGNRYVYPNTIIFTESFYAKSTYDF